jgi:hypothetical protein
VCAAVTANGAMSAMAASASTEAGFRDVARNLAGVPALEMPEWVAAKVDRALAAEKTRRGTG